jgi:DNA modification methylase
VKLLTMPGENLVLDPFAGSGTTTAACVLEGVPYYCIDLREQHCEIARARVAHFTKK